MRCATSLICGATTRMSLTRLTVLPSSQSSTVLFAICLPTVQMVCTLASMLRATTRMFCSSPTATMHTTNATATGIHHRVKIRMSLATMVGVSASSVVLDDGLQDRPGVFLDLPGDRTRRLRQLRRLLQVEQRRGVVQNPLPDDHHPIEPLVDHEDCPSDPVDQGHHRDDGQTGAHERGSPYKEHRGVIRAGCYKHPHLPFDCCVDVCVASDVRTSRRSERRTRQER